MQRLGSRLHGSVEFADGSLDVLEAARDRKKGVIFVTGHVGNFELLASVVARRVPLSVLARKSYDPRFSRLIERFRGASSVETIWVDERSHLLQAASALREGRVLGVLLDQPTQAQSGLAVPFFGRPAPTSAIAASLARSTGAALVCGFIVRRADGRQVVSISAVGMADGARDQQQLATTARLTAEIERVIRAHPDQWLWTLDRWRGRGRTA
jgi:KDO2-lipid IV(A) lauroyltransferase